MSFARWNAQASSYRAHPEAIAGWFIEAIPRGKSPFLFTLRI